MEATPSSGGSKDTTVTVKINSEFRDEFDKSLKKAQIDGEVSLDMSRSEALRKMMELAVRDPEIFERLEE